MLKKSRMFLMSVMLFFGQCCAMEHCITWDTISSDAIEELNQVFAELRTIFENHCVVEEHTIDDLRRDFAKRNYAANVSCLKWKLSRSKLANTKMQDMWADVQVCVGIAEHERKPVLMADADLGTLEEGAVFSAKLNRVVANPSSEIDWSVMRPMMIHEAGHMLLAHEYKTFWYESEHRAHFYSIKDLSFSYFVATFDISLLSTDIAQSEQVNSLIDRLKNFDAHVRNFGVAKFLGEHCPEEAREDYSHLSPLSLSMEHEADQFLLKNIDCAQCLHAMARLIKKTGSEEGRAARGYASVEDLEVRARELEGKMCSWHTRRAARSVYEKAWDHVVENRWTYGAICGSIALIVVVRHFRRLPK